MSLIIKPSDGRGQDLAALMADQIKVVVLDIDDTMFHPHTGLHHKIVSSIHRDINESPDLKKFREQWTREGLIDHTGAMGPSSINVVYPAIINHYRQHGPQDLMRYLARVYSVDYNVIPPDPELVRSVEKLRANDIRVVLYTNGPYGEVDGNKLHANKVLDRLGFPPNSFGEADIVDVLKTDRNPQLVSQFGFAAEHVLEVFRKPRADAFSRAGEILGFTPGPHVMFVDDSIANVGAAVSLGIVGVHAVIDPSHLDDQGMMSKRDYAAWTVKADGAGNSLSVAGRLLHEMASLMPEPRSAAHAKPGLFARLGKE